MAKVSGIGANLYVDQYDLSGDTGALQTISNRRAVLDVTAIDKSGYERVPGLKDGQLTFTGFWNTSAGQQHLALRSMPTTDRIVTYANALTLGADACSLTGKQVEYSQTRGQDGSLVWNTDALANMQGLEWGYLLTTGKQTFASSGSGTSIDDYGGTSTLFGAAGYLHVFSVGSGTPTVAIQDSASAGSGFADLTGMVFTASPAATSERKQGLTNATVRRYLRVNVTGTFTNLVFAVTVVRYLVSPDT